MDSGRAGRPGATEAAPSAPPPFAHVAPSLFLGNARAAAASELLVRAGVTLCVNVSRQQPGPRAPGVAELRVPVFDDPAEDLLAHLEPTCAAIEAAVRAGGACLVYCKNGRSRSAAVCTAYLMRHRGLSLAQAFQTVKSARPVAEPNPGFWSQLQQYEEALRSQLPGASLVSTALSPGLMSCSHRHASNAPATCASDLFTPLLVHMHLTWASDGLRTRLENVSPSTLLK
ncbi:PREDICTED: dual specificity phosphatase 28 isoform X1 [Hipposideros armiger]|uniref:Dual specificity phosphatase 28 n=1 Tax=Hipposideros armiger TaxID=186990 RepID=A0A8B7Q9B4_HIPAR|nr:PREDICTED: dual specificity phosphatase 28 isoform X1 [Hipposideros armiger]